MDVRWNMIIERAVLRTSSGELYTHLVRKRGEKRRRLRDDAYSFERVDKVCLELVMVSALSIASQYER